MQTSLRIDDTIYRRAKVAAAERGLTMTHFIEAALTRELSTPVSKSPTDAALEERNQLMEALLQRTAGFKVGKRPSRKEMNER